MCKLNDFDYLRLTKAHRIMLETELDEWHRSYIPPGRIPGREFEGQVVLDLGAGSGETAQFFLLHGADHVISIEGDPIALRNLIMNFHLNQKVTIIPQFVHFIKSDIEGSEEWLTVETHFSTRFRKLATNPFGHHVNIYRIERSSLARFDTIGISIHQTKIKLAHKIRLMINHLKGID